MITICIPVYNYPVSELVLSLGQQIASLEVPAEIVVIDDRSTQEHRDINRLACEGHTYIELEENVGRARIRNLFPGHARYDYLLFLDCDSRIPVSGFLSGYASALKEGPEKVICGGRVYPPERPSRERLLRWKYGVTREARPPAVRSEDPARSFMTNNFLVHRKVLEMVPFDARVTGYGHEDTLFGFRLMKEGIAVGHIANPVLNGDLETNREFLEKTMQGVENLVRILDFVEDREGFIRQVRLLEYHQSLQSNGLDRWVAVLYYLTGPAVRLALSAGIAGLKLFDFYKLGELMKMMKRKSGKQQQTIQVGSG